MKNYLAILILMVTLISLFQCNNPPLTKLNDELISGRDAKKALLAYFPATSLEVNLTDKILIQSISGLNDSSYYTRKSVDACKEKIYIMSYFIDRKIILSGCKFQSAGFIQSGATKIL